MLVLLIHKIWVSKLVKNLRGVKLDEVPEGIMPERGFFDQRGGVVIFLFKIARLGGVLALLGLSVFAAIRHAWKVFDLALVATLVCRTPLSKSQ